MPNIVQALKTDVGKVRQRNEDAVGAKATVNGWVFVVCDGMGGHPGGDVASQIAVDTFLDFFSDQLYPEEVLPQALEKAFEKANQVILAKGEEIAELEGLGTTAVVAVVREKKAWFAHIGDSRLYYFANGELRQMTEDHSYVQSLISMGEISEEEALHHPRRNQVTQVLGIPKAKASVSLQAISMEEGHILMLCTDGLTNMLREEDLRKILKEEALSLEAKSFLMVNMANQKGGVDNISVALCQYRRENKKEEAAPIVEEATKKSEKPVEKEILPPTSPAAIVVEEKANGDKTSGYGWVITFLAFLLFGAFMAWLVIHQRNTAEAMIAGNQAKLDSLTLLSERLSAAIAESEADEEMRRNQIFDNYFDSFDSDNYRVYGLLRDRQKKYTTANVSVKFNVFNTNAIKTSEILGERWHIVPVKGVHFMLPGETVSDLAKKYYLNPADSVLIKEFNTIIKPGKQIFIPFNK